jgi:hypothetical protein
VSRSLEGPEKDDSTSPNRDVEIHQELVDAFRNPGYITEL